MTVTQGNLSHAEFRERAMKDGYDVLKLLPRDWDAQRALAALVCCETYIEKVAEKMTR